MSRLIVGPFNRVEGDLEVTLDVDRGRVRDAWVNSPLYRGFEQILHGKPPLDALVFTPRLCGICSVSQSVACAAALADAMGVEPPPNGRTSINLLLATENLADHFTHFYLFFMPDFAREVYSREPWFEAVAARFKAVKGDAARAVLPARADLLNIMGILGGKWPHTLTLQPGGSARAVQPRELIRLKVILASFRRFLEAQTFGAGLERIADIATADELLAWADEAPWDSSDLRTFLHLSGALDLQNLGRGSDHFMSYGSYPTEQGHLFARGVWRGEVSPLSPEAITEDVSHSWLRDVDTPRHPSRGVTLPDPDQTDGYTWCKAPRLAGEVMEVGALARQVVDGHPLARALVAECGGSVRNRVVARLLEIARVLPALERWVDALEPGAPFCEHGPVPEEATGVGLVEAARGSLGHWLDVQKGRIANYQIVAPTTWNFSPRSGEGVPGALEQALRGTPVRDGEHDPVAVQHVVRSFDPCMVCTVH